MKLLSSAALFAVISTQAFAWDAMVNGPDVFGETTVLAGEEGMQSKLVVQCNSKGEVVIAMISPKKQFDSVNETEAALFFAFNADQPVKISARLRSWNDNFAGVVSTATKDETIPLLIGIRDAKGPIKAGADILGNKISDSYSSSGSTAAMKTLLEKCKLSDN